MSNGVSLEGAAKQMRTKDPSYHVFQLVELQQLRSASEAQERVKAWVPLTTSPVKAGTRKDAVSQVSKDDGVFMVIKDDQVWEGTRGVETITQESWT